MVSNAFKSSEDNSLLHQIAEGNELAFEVLYQRYSTPLFTYLLRLVHDNDAAEELLQDVFLTVWQNAQGFRGDASVKTWLFRIAHHRAVSWLRKRRDSSNGDLDALSGRDMSSDPEGQTIAAWKAAQIRAALESLSVKQRAVLELAIFFDLPYTEIAQVMQCPIGTVKSRLSYARRSLLQYLQDHELDEFQEKQEP